MIKISGVNKKSPSLSQTWDAALAITARAWARMCVFKHNIYLREVKKVHPNFNSVGENLWTGYPPQTFSVGNAMKSWVDKELKHYDYDRHYCTPGEMCGHYTQVNWLVFSLANTVCEISLKSLVWEAEQHAHLPLKKKIVLVVLQIQNHLPIVCTGSVGWQL